MERTGTRERLILAAETLFGQKGIDAVSLREINVAAGQRNTSASHYHFGSKEALVIAIFDLRQEAIGRKRGDLLDRLAAEHGPLDVRALARVLVDPLAESITSGEESGHFVSFLAQLFMQPTSCWRSLLERPDGGLPRLSHELSKIVGIPEGLAAHRMTVMSQHVATSLASHQRWLGQDGAGYAQPLPFEVFVVTLVDGVTAYLSAPVSEELRAALTLAGLQIAHS